MEKKTNKILIIEDEKFLLEMYKMRFKKAGYEVLVAESGALGTEIAKAESPDLIIIDIVLPENDGYQVIMDIRKDSRTRKTPILIFSNLGQQEEINRGLELGADGYVIKTDLTPLELLAKVERMLVLARGGERKKRILIIEGRNEIAKSYQPQLVKNGFEVEVINEGAKALKAAGYGDFDLILLDIALVSFNGREALKQLKTDLRTKHVPVFVFSESTTEGEIRQILQMGAKKYFVKSKMMPDQIVKEVKDVLG